MRVISPYAMLFGQPLRGFGGSFMVWGILVHDDKERKSELIGYSGKRRVMAGKPGLTKTGLRNAIASICGISRTGGGEPVDECRIVAVSDRHGANWEDKS